MEDKKLEKSIQDLERALTFEKEAKTDTFYMAGIAKCYEICLEYAWKYFKRMATEEGIEVFSPKEAIKMAGRLKIIGDVEKWLEFLAERNMAVHDYLGVSDQEYLETIHEFLKEVKNIKLL